MITSSNGNIFRVIGPLCKNSPVTGESPSQKPAARSFGVFYDLCLNKRLSKQSWGWWFETPLRSLCRHCTGQISKSLHLIGRSIVGRFHLRVPHHQIFAVIWQGWKGSGIIVPTVSASRQSLFVAVPCIWNDLCYCGIVCFPCDICPSNKSW